MSEGYIIRHSKAGYKSYDKQLAGENPEGSFKHHEQIDLDLTEAGEALAKESAQEFFNGLNLDKDELYFASSNEARAIETAGIYRQEAKARGFEIVKPEPARSRSARSEYAERIGEGEIRVMLSLSLNTDNLLRFLVFSGSEPTVNWDAVDEETKKRWQEARKAIEADNRGSWGANFAAHSEKIQEILPGVETAKRFYETRFKSLLRFLKLADTEIKKYKESTGKTKNIKVLLFGHEDYLVQFLKDELQEEGIKNCEALQLETSKDGTVTAHYRGKTKEL